jgi:DNA-binding CsgD family transcriptional regulator
VRSEREILAAVRRLAREAHVDLATGTSAAAANALRALAETAPQPHAVSRALDLEAELRPHLRERRAQRRAELARSLERLRRAESTAELIEHTCEQAARGCGLRRVLLSRIRDGVWSPWKLHDGHDRAAPVAAIPLDDALVQQGLRRLLQWEHYVFAPIAPAGEPLGMLHADASDDDDHELLQAFADSFGRIYERTALRERLDAERTRIHAVTTETENIASDAQAQIDLVRLVGSEQPPGPATTALTPLPRRTTPDDALTPRERDVLALMAEGRSNANIAEQLAVEPSTVKSHVRAILRKLGAVNRVEAIAAASK